MSRLGCVQCGAHFQPPPAQQARIIATLNCPRCGGGFERIWARRPPRPEKTARQDAVPLARVHLNASKSPDSPEPQIEELNNGIDLRARPSVTSKPRRLVKLSRRDGALPTADVLALPANLGRHAPAPEETPTFTAPEPMSHTRWWVALAVLLTTALAGLGWHHIRPPERALRLTMQAMQAGIRRAWTTPLAGTGSVDTEVLDIETDAAAGVMLVHGLIHNGTDDALDAMRLEVRLRVGAVPIRRRVVQCCDDLELSEALNMPRQHAHLRGGATQMAVDARGQQTFSIVFPGLAPQHFDAPPSAVIRVLKAP